ncbi:unnamed protein product [Amoebophrya sp. A120]|nr:unnamed protein product [Amoebophrya sp. A120]|eukprot:GSA120T00020561001.1
MTTSLTLKIVAPPKYSNSQFCMINCSIPLVAVEIPRFVLVDQRPLRPCNRQNTALLLDCLCLEI